MNKLFDYIDEKIYRQMRKKYPQAKATDLLEKHAPDWYYRMLERHKKRLFNGLKFGTAVKPGIYSYKTDPATSKPLDEARQPDAPAVEEVGLSKHPEWLADVE